MTTRCRSYRVLSAAVICAVGFSLSTASSALAGFFEDAWGVVTDPLKIGKASDNAVHAVERLAIHVERIQRQLDESAKNRIDQVGLVLRQTKFDVDDSIAKMFAQVASFQTKFFADTAELVRCSGEVTGEALRSNLAKSLNDLGQRKPRLKFFGWTILTAEIDENDIESPIESFRKVKLLYDQKLAKIGSDDHPSRITDIYAEVARLARLTRCHYHQDSGKWIELYSEYELENIRLQKYWTRVVPL